jgi:hypothetical protein
MCENQPQPANLFAPPRGATTDHHAGSRPVHPRGVHEPGATRACFQLQPAVPRARRFVVFDRRAAAHGDHESFRRHGHGDPRLRGQLREAGLDPPENDQTRAGPRVQPAADARPRMVGTTFFRRRERPHRSRQCAVNERHRISVAPEERRVVRRSRWRQVPVEPGLGDVQRRPDGRREQAHRDPRQRPMQRRSDSGSARGSTPRWASTASRPTTGRRWPPR